MCAHALGRRLPAPLPLSRPLRLPRLQAQIDGAQHRYIKYADANN